ncbi:hypothetical protein SASPL_153983 [Salvia splendens]|uniref:Transposase MuDR plant domain-containing protein n=1 Tax=Salvia splendens TaxID=180675 RepID=A0A8X8VZA6_SALSN|nr:hypothetical protein SASPL_153983 [Salvia splendens]
MSSITDTMNEIMEEYMIKFSESLLLKNVIPPEDGRGDTSSGEEEEGDDSDPQSSKSDSSDDETEAGSSSDEAETRRTLENLKSPIPEPKFNPKSASRAKARYPHRSEIHGDLSRRYQRSKIEEKKSVEESVGTQAATRKAEAKATMADPRAPASMPENEILASFVRSLELRTLPGPARERNPPGRQPAPPPSGNELRLKIRIVSIFIDGGRRLENGIEEKSQEVAAEILGKMWVTMKSRVTDIVVKERNIVGYDDITKLLEGCVGNDDNENISDYASSGSDVHSFESDDNDDDIGRFKCRRRRIVYNPKCDHRSLNIRFGMQFQDVSECKEALTTCAIETGKFIHFNRVEKDHLEAKCNPPCPWRVYASVVRDKKIVEIKAYDDLSRGTRKELPQVSISANARQMKERALARKGVGVIGFEESGNIYMWMSSHNKVTHVTKEILSTSSSRIRSNVVKVRSTQGRLEGFKDMASGSQREFGGKVNFTSLVAPVAGMSLLKERLSLIGDVKAKELDDKWKQLFMEESEQSCMIWMLMK